MQATRLLGPRGIWLHLLRKLGAPPPRSVQLCLDALQGGRGLEVGGPSDLFRAGGCVPIYEVVADLDGCNFSDETLWQGKLAAGRTYQYRPDRPPGRLFIADAVSLQGIEAGQYDFVASSHVLEHVANPLRAIGAQLRVIKDGGLLLIVLPHGAAAFDWRRPMTSFEHILGDYERDVGEDDLSHVDEFLERIDLDITPFPGGREALAERAHRNREHRIVHHHVFNGRLVQRMLEHHRLDVISLDALWPFHIVALARKHAGRSGVTLAG
jgi:SAM-dependent methyltransferase